MYRRTTHGITITYIIKKLPEVSEYDEKRHDMMTSLKHNNDVTCLLMCSCYFFLIFRTSWYGVCKIELFHMGYNSRYPDPGV